jgi:hypothetical protein
MTDREAEATAPIKYKSIQVPEGSPAHRLARELARRLEGRSSVPCTVAMYQAVEMALKILSLMTDEDLDDYLANE